MKRIMFVLVLSLLMMMVGGCGKLDCSGYQEVIDAYEFNWMECEKRTKIVYDECYIDHIEGNVESVCGARQLGRIMEILSYITDDGDYASDYWIYHEYDENTKEFVYWKLQAFDIYEFTCGEIKSLMPCNHSIHCYPSIECD